MHRGVYHHAAQEFEKLREDETIRFPEKYFHQTRRKAGAYQGCFSKSHWGHKRIAHKWDLFCEIAPRQARCMSEIPNHLKAVLGIDEFKHNNSKFKLSDGSHQVPLPLMRAMESILMERIHLGEEVTTSFCGAVLTKMVDVWNDHIAALKPEVAKIVGQNLLKEQDQQMSEDVSESEMSIRQKHATEGLEAALESLRPIVLSSNHRTLEILSSNTS